MDRLVVLFEKHYGFYFTIVFRILGNAADAEDVLQIAFMKAYRSATEHIGDQDLKRWFVVVCKNTALSYLEKNIKDAEREKAYFMEREAHYNVEDEAVLGIVVEQQLDTIPPELAPYLREHILDEVPIKVICRKYGVSRDKMRYWKKQLEKNLKNIL